MLRVFCETKDLQILIYRALCLRRCKAPLCKGGSRIAGGGLSQCFVLQSLRHGKPRHLPLHKGGFWGNFASNSNSPINPNLASSNFDLSGCLFERWQPRSLPPGGRGTTKWWKELACTKIFTPVSKRCALPQLRVLPSSRSCARATSLPEGGLVKFCRLNNGHKITDKSQFGALRRQCSIWCVRTRAI